MDVPVRAIAEVVDADRAAPVRVRPAVHACVDHEEPLAPKQVWLFTSLLSSVLNC
ncbi:hypothetical protein [Lysobacter sp. TY2-98]|uniref:hypothetical protein n=1 Tax=Lysobacter sp. TY2-98 TaxID=2290922 RepID=UPI0013B42625|nr:hypothetical protein [Lysobacter sp. TY2-98]